MKKMSFESIFNWLYAKTLDRAMHSASVSHPTCTRLAPVSYLSRISLIALLLLFWGGWNTQAWAGRVTGITAVESGKGSVYVKVERQRIYGWENANTGNTVDQDSSDPSQAEYSSSFYAKQAVFTVVSSGIGYTFEGWYEEDGTYLSNSTSYPGPYVTSGADRTYKYFARFAPIQYNIAFNANYGAGGTGTGTTATVANVKYDRDTTLTLNGYSKIAYIVTYNANGGSGLAKSSDNSYYSFDKWTQNSNGSGTQYANGATVSNLSATDKATVTLYAKWGTTASKIILPVAPSVAPENKTFAGWFVDGDAKETVVGIAGDEYTPTGNVTLKAKWTSVKIPGFTGSNQTLTVGETYNFGFSNTSTATPSSSSSANFYYVISDEVVNTDNTTGSLDGTKVISFSGNTITALNKGTAKIKFYQKADAGNNIVAGESAEFTITVNKKEPTITWASAPYNYNSTINNFYSSDNKDTEIAAISRNTEVASISGASLTMYNKAGSARIVVSQAENYKWAAKKDSISVTPEKKNKHVEFTINADNNGNIEVTKTANVVWQSTGYYKLGTGDWGTSKPDDNVVIGFEGIPDKLSFTLSCDPVEFFGTHYPGKNDYTFEVFESATNGSWNSIWTNDNSKEYSESENVEIHLSASTRFIKLRYSGTCWGRFTNIAVSELQYFRRQGENTTLDFATNLKNHVPEVQSFVVEHANAGYQTSVTAPDHYQVSLDNVNFASEVVYSTNATALTGGDKKGTFVVYVKYLADAEGTHADNVVVHNNLRADFNVPVTGTTQGKYATTLHFKASETTFSVDDANVDATDLFEVHDPNGKVVPGAVITLSKSETGAIDIISDDKVVDFKCGGSATITAHYAGDNTTYQAASDVGQAITITRRADEINFDNARSTLVVGDEIDLSDWASAESESEITYKVMSSDQLTGSIKIENGKLIALSAGTVRIKATSEGNCLYDSGYDFHNMKVRNPEDPCGSLLLDKSATVKCGVTANTSESPQVYTISAGPMDELKFKIWRVTAAGDQVTIRFVDKDGNAVPNGTYTYSAGSLGTSKPDNYTVIDVSNITGATKLQIYGGGLLNKYVSNVQITQKAYLTTYVGSTQLEPTANVTMPEVKACNTSTKDITIKYSDLTPIQLSHTNDVFTYEIYKGENKVGFFDNDCRGFGTYTVRCICTPTSKGEYSDVLTLTASGQSQTINLSLNATAPEREIVWDIPTGNTISATQSVDLTAYAKTDCESPAGSVYYTYSPAVDGAATIDGARITFNKAATITVTAHTVTSDMYEDATTVDKVWTVGKVGTQMKTLPTITSTITYGDNSSVVTHNNTFTAVSVLDNTHEVAGSIAYVSPTNFTAAGETNLIFTFTPTIEWDVYEPIQFTVPVTVQKAETTLSWTAYPTSVVYGNTATYAASSVSDGTITYSIKEGNKYAGIDANTGVLTVIEAGHTVIVQASQAAGTNYVTPQAITTEVVLNKADATLEWVTAQASVEYGATGVLYVASSVSDGAITYSIIAGSDCASIDSESGELTITKAGSFTVQASQTAGTNYVTPEAITKDVTITKITPTLTWTTAPTELAYNAEGVTYEASSTSSEGAITYSIKEGDAYASIDAETGELTIIEAGHTITVQASQAESNNYNAPTSITVEVTIGAAPLVNVFTNEAGNGDWENPDNWESRIVPTSDPDIIVTGALEVKEDITVGSLTIEQTGSVSVISGGTLTVKGVSEERTSYGDVHVKETGNLVLLGNVAELKVNDFILDASLNGLDAEAHNKTAMSGQVTNAEKIEKRGHAYFDLSFDPSGKISYGWYDFTVPFEVNIAGGISRINSTSDKVMVCGQDFLIMEADEVNRANGGKGWRQFSSGVLKPGKLYTITFDDDVNQNTFRFTWNEAGSLQNGASYDAQCAAGSEESLRGWNGLGNGMLRHGYLAGNYKTQVYNHGENRYELVQGDKTFAVGTAFFIQVEAAGNVGWTAAVATEGRPLYAPRYEAAEVDEFCLQLRKEEETRATDVLYFSASEEATEDYIIGHDLLKMGTPKESKVAQMWTTKGGKALCDIESTLNGNQASAPLMFYAPTAGSYQLAIDKAPEDATLYLTYNGVAIWALSSSPYTLDLEKGTTEGYGLRLETSNAPQITTGVENTSAEDQARKVIIDNTMYIITKEGAIFNATGKKVQ